MTEYMLGMKSAQSFSVHYKFGQHFNFPPKDAYRWCTDYQPEDVELMGEKGSRKIQRINEDTLVLTDYLISQKGKVTKRRLVRLYPERLSWTNTRMSDKGKHSQFLYEIMHDKGGSKLIFTGSQVFEEPRPSQKKVASIARTLEREDSATWRRLARAMEIDLTRRTAI